MATDSDNAAPTPETIAPGVAAQVPGSAACKDCRFWRSDSEDATGECRRRAPISALKHLGSQLFFFGYRTRGWAETEPDDWCGEHQPNDQPR